MNGSVDPCKDFYRYSCGKWLADNPVPGTHSRWSYIDVLTDQVNNVTQRILSEERSDSDARPINQAKEYFTACMDVEAIEAEGLQPVMNIIEEFGGWQLLNSGTWNSFDLDWLQAVAELRRRTMTNVIVGAAVIEDPTNTTRHLVIA